MTEQHVNGRVLDRPVTVTDISPVRQVQDLVARAGEADVTQHDQVFEARAALGPAEVEWARSLLKADLESLQRR